MMQDAVVIGGGPAGLSAALNAAAEGLSVLLLERESQLGGQAVTSSRIENYLGFPGGVAGEPLIRRAAAQARRLGATLQTGHAVVRVQFNVATGLWMVECATGCRHIARVVILASGVDYRRLDIPGGERALYGAPSSSHDECHDMDVVVVGGGNSAGQAALNLSKIGARVHLLVRRPLYRTMSSYLIERIAVDPHIEAVIGEAAEIRKHAVVVGSLEAATIPSQRVFAYIGMHPRTDFIKDCCSVNRPGYIHTDENFAANEDGLFVAGDVRAGSFKRVAAAVGEGAIAAAAAWRRIYEDRT